MIKKICLLLILLICGCGQKTAIQKEIIFSPANESIEITVEGMENCGNKKLAFIQHGLAASQKHQAVVAAKNAFLAKGYVVVTFDSRYSLGENSRDVEKARLSTFIKDLTDVVNWAAKQNFYSEPFALAGHSLGGASVLSYAAQYPQKVDRLVGIAPIISGNLWEYACFRNMPEFCRNWKSSGFYMYLPPDGKAEVRISYKTLDEAKTFDILMETAKFKSSVLLIAAEKDNIIPPQNIKKLYDALLSPRQMSIIANSSHNFVSNQNQADLTAAVRAFLSARDKF